jgi:endo-1,4-beta-xylanase
MNPKRSGFPLAATLLAVSMGYAHAADVHEIQLLWPNGAPGSLAGAGEERIRINELGEHIVSSVHAPSITVYLPQAAKTARAAVIVIPGGGHAELWMDHEGYRVAEFLADHGVAAFVLKYRLAHEKGSPYTVEGDALADAQRAIRLVRSQSAQWHLDPQRIGVMGFSAGGELAALAASRDESGARSGARSGVRSGAPGPRDAVQMSSSRPSFQALLYPAIPLGLSLSPQTPPAFLLGGAEDHAAISQGLAELYLAMRRAGARAELHLYEGVGHGFGLRANNSTPVSGWPQRFLDWLDQIEPQQRQETK